jgi:hypothetical protein
MKHFDINVHEAHEGVWHANIYPLAPGPFPSETYTDTSAMLATVFLTPQEAADLDFPHDEWYGTEDPLPETLQDALGIVLDELRAA